MKKYDETKFVLLAIADNDKLKENMEELGFLRRLVNAEKSLEQAASEMANFKEKAAQKVKDLEEKLKLEKKEKKKGDNEDNEDEDNVDDNGT